MPKTYRHIFFDLDRTLWDYDTNAEEAIFEIFQTYQLNKKVENFKQFHRSFEKHNDQLWTDFREGRVHKDELRVLRFDLTLQEFEINDRELAVQLNRDFLEISPRKSRLLPGAIELLDYLFQKRYRMYIITNGFTRIQKMKVEASGIEKYFQKMFTCDNVNAHKPKREMFARALTWANARKVDSLMVGDDLPVDIIGARNYGIDQLYLNPKGIVHNEKVTFEVASLPEIHSIL